MNSTFMSTFQGQIQSMLSAMQTGGLRNFSAAFRNMTGFHYFWNYSGGRRYPRGGSMGSGMM